MFAMVKSPDLSRRDCRGLDGDPKSKVQQGYLQPKARSNAKDGEGPAFLPREEWA